MSTKVLEDLRTAREAAGRVLGRRPATTPEQLDECVQILDEIARFVERWPSLSQQDVRSMAPVAAAGIIEVRERLKARRKDGGA